MCSRLDASESLLFAEAGSSSGLAAALAPLMEEEEENGCVDVIGIDALRFEFEGAKETLLLLLLKEAMLTGEALLIDELVGSSVNDDGCCDGVGRDVLALPLFDVRGSLLPPLLPEEYKAYEYGVASFDKAKPPTSAKPKFVPTGLAGNA